MVGGWLVELGAALVPGGEGGQSDRVGVERRGGQPSVKQPSGSQATSQLVYYNCIISS